MPSSFRLIELLGEGGMGAVWRAEHMPSGLHVAVKVIHDVHSETGRRAFAREIRSVAALNHRGIVHILDVGEGESTDQDLPEGAPWFAMELSEGGTLEGMQLKSFGELARILFDIFDALAYAHARGIVHRDLKPSNILLTADVEHEWRPVLTDFGIAKATGDMNLEERTSSTSGTPAYMSPEQFHGDWRKTGPWTDLYALGCMIYELAVGQIPFSAKSMLELARKHFTEPLPKLVPRFDVPPRFEAWLRRMTHKNPELRYRNAAHASWALFRMVSENPRWMPATLAHTLTMPGAQVPTMTMDSMFTAKLDLEEMGLLLASDTHDHGEMLDLEDPPIPFHVVEAGESRGRHLFGAGLNLFGLRQTPFVGRSEEREVLWNSLLRAARGKLVRVIVEGDAGSGRSRLLDWFVTRVLELGAAQVVRVRHTRTSSGSHGIIPALESALGLTALAGNELIERILSVLEAVSERNALNTPPAVLTSRAREIAALFDERNSHTSNIQHESPRERYEAVTWLLTYLTHDGPLVLGVDDAQWGWDTLGFIEFLKRETAAPILCLIMAEPDVKCRAARGFLDGLLSGGTTVLHLGNLSPSEHESFVRALAPLERRAAAKIANASQGHPGRAVQLVDSLIRGEELVPSPEGYRLAHEANVTRELSAVWTRLRNKLYQLYPIGAHQSVSMALEAAVVMGGDVELSEWDELLKHLDISLDAETLVHHCVSLGIAYRRGDRWAFRNREHVEELRNDCQESEYWESLHRACAELARPASGVSLSERRFTYFDQGGLEEEAALALADAVEDYLHRNAYQRASLLADELERRLARLGVAPDDRRRVRVVTARFEILRFTGRVKDVLAAKEAFERHVVTCADHLARADAYRALAGALYVTGNKEGAAAYYQLAFEQADGDPFLSAKLMHGSGWVYSNGPHLDKAEECYKAGVEFGRRSGEARETAWNLVGLAELRLRALNPECEEIAAEALELFESVGSRAGAAMALQVLGDLARMTGNEDLAEELYLRSIEMLQRVGSVVESMVRGRLGILYLRQGKEAAALEQAKTGQLRYGTLLSVPVRVFDDLLVATLDPDPEVRAQSWKIAKDLLESTGFQHPDLPALLAERERRHGQD